MAGAVTPPQPGDIVRLGGENILVVECPACKHSEVWCPDLPMNLDAFAARLKALATCGKCGAGGGALLIGDRLKAAIEDLHL